MRNPKFLIIIFLILSFVTRSLAAQSVGNDSLVVTIESDKVVKIWDKAPHNAFTDLIRFNNTFYCSFREGSGHIPGTDGKVRIIKSTDGRKWTSMALLEKKGIDLRDPKLSVTPEGRLMVIMGGSVYKEGEMLERIPQVSFSDTSGSSFSKPKKIIIDPEVQNNWDWIWRVTWNNGTGYAINWQLQNWESGHPTGTIYLMKTADGIHYKKVSYLDVCGYPNESTIRIDKNGKMYVLIRREKGDQKGIIVASIPPYNSFNFQKLTVRLGGPNFRFLSDKKLIIGTRKYGAKSKTAILVTDLKGEIKKEIVLPSEGDTSYPGMVLYDEKLWVSYYSSHGDKNTAIYLAKIPIEQLN